MRFFRLSFSSLLSLSPREPEKRTEKEKRKKLPKSLAVKIKPLTFAPAFENEAQVL